MTVDVQFSSAREHPRWGSLVDLSDQGGSKKAPTAKQKQQQSQRLDRLKRRFGVSIRDGDTVPPDLAHDVSGKSKASPQLSALGPNYSSQEHTLRNDYSQHFVDTGAGQLPANAVRNPWSSSRFQEYPKLRRLVQLKDSLVTRVAHPPTYLQADLRPSLEPFRNACRPADQFHLGSLIPVKYDVVLIDPPLEAYEWEATPSASTSAQNNHTAATWSWEEIAALPVPQLAAKESFVFLWVGSGAGDGLERGREVLAKWGYRRCEDIVCIRTNQQTDQYGASSQQPSTSSAFTRSSQHCLMGIRGTVRRSTDARFVHCNIDTDVILWPGPEQEVATERGGADQTLSHMLPDMASKPSELYQTIENFCLGTRRLELFGRNRNLRRGWLTIGLQVGPDQHGWPQDGKVPLPTAGLPVLEEDDPDQRLQAHLEHLQIPRPYDKVEYDANFGVDRPGCDLRDRCNLVPYVEEVDQLRPKSPPPRGANGAFARDSNNQRYRAETQLGEAYRQGGPGTAMPNGLGSNPALRNMQPSLHPEPNALHAYGRAGAMPLSAHAIGMEYGLPSTLAARTTGGGGGAGLSGLGAGGARTVSVPSGSDTLSGPQASVVKAKALAEAAAAAAASAASTTVFPTDQANPSIG